MKTYSTKNSLIIIFGVVSFILSLAANLFIVYAGYEFTRLPENAGLTALAPVFGAAFGVTVTSITTFGMVPLLTLKQEKSYRIKIILLGLLVNLPAILFMALALSYIVFITINGVYFRNTGQI